MKPSPASNERSTSTPAANDRVVLRWHEEVDPKRLDRVAEIIADILDNETTPAESAKS